MRPETESILAVFIVLVLAILALSGIVYLDKDGRTMDVMLKNVSDQDLPYAVYVNEDLVQEGVLISGGTAHYQYVKPFGPWNRWTPDVVSVVTPNTVHRLAIEPGDDPYFVLD